MSNVDFSNTASYPQIQVTDRTSLSVGDTVQLALAENFGANQRFLRVIQILHNRIDGGVNLKGFLLIRVKHSGLLLQGRVNEVYIAVDHVREDVTELWPDPSIAIRDVDAFTEVQFDDQDQPIKRELRFTNRRYPEDNICTEIDFDDKNVQQIRFIQQHEMLTCRWMMIEHRQAKRVKTDRLPSSARIKMLQTKDIFALTGMAANIEDFTLFETYRGSLPTEDMLTCGDGFCGAGGFSQGAAKAGLVIRLAFDMDGKPCGTYKLNQPGSTVYKLDVFRFISLVAEHPGQFRVDVLHISPPCQGWSRQNPFAGHRDPNSRQGKLDEARQAASFVTAALIRKCKPRILSMEQTNCILDPDKVDFFRGIIADITGEDFSVAWQIRNCAGDGHPHARWRLCLLAACPGEVLPPFAPATHGPGTQTQYTTIGDRISLIDETLSDHDPHYERLKPERAIKPDQMLRNIIDCYGTKDTLWDPDPAKNGREFTVRENAVMMGLPPHFQFHALLFKGDKKQQIGNMVVPDTAEKLDEDCCC